MDYKDAPLEHRNTIARAMFRAWWYPFSHYGVIHGDPHLGNYTIFETGANGSAGAGGSWARRPASTCSTTAASAPSPRRSCRA